MTIALEVASKTNKQLLDEGPVLFIVPATWQSLITMEAAASATKYQTDPFFPPGPYFSPGRLVAVGWLVGMVWYGMV